MLLQIKGYGTVYTPIFSKTFRKILSFPAFYLTSQSDVKGSKQIA